MVTILKLPMKLNMMTKDNPLDLNILSGVKTSTISTDILIERLKGFEDNDLDLNVWFGVKTHMYPQTSCCGRFASLKYLSQLPGQPVYTNPPCSNTSESEI